MRLQPASGQPGGLYNQFLKTGVDFISSPVRATSDSEDKLAACQTSGGSKVSFESPESLLPLICVKFLHSEQWKACRHCSHTAAEAVSYADNHPHEA